MYWVYFSLASCAILAIFFNILFVFKRSHINPNDFFLCRFASRKQWPVTCSEWESWVCSTHTRTRILSGLTVLHLFSSLHKVGTVAGHVFGPLESEFGLGAYARLLFHVWLFVAQFGFPNLLTYLLLCVSFFCFLCVKSKSVF